MRDVTKVLLLLLLLLVAITAWIFGTQNSAIVTLHFLDVETPEAPISLWVGIGFLGGIGLGLLLSAWSNTRLRLRARSARRALEKQISVTARQPVDESAVAD